MAIGDLRSFWKKVSCMAMMLIYEFNANLQIANLAKIGYEIRKRKKIRKFLFHTISYICPNPSVSIGAD